LEDFVKKLTAAERENENARRAANEQKRLYRKLTDDEIKSVEDLKRALQGSVDEQMKAVNAIEVEKKSYNELNQVYNALKDTLNRMTTAQRQNTDAGKAMTAQASKVYETMNQLQQATGKYTLQVGKCRAAFDGLGYSMQQILREAPSALNLNQFFLAISNNIPQFLDQLKAFKDEQADIAENLKKMTEGTEEYIKEQGKQMTVGKKLWKSIMSWQTIVLVGLMAIRNYGEKIIDWFSDLFSGSKKAESALKIFDMTMRDINRNAASAIANASTELSILMERLDGVTKGTEDWKKIVERVNEITGETLDYQKAMPDEIRKVTQAYLDQMLAIEKN
jgi:chromosome segregation ATPase